MDRWASLTTREQFSIALDVARRRGLKLCSIIDNVVSVGAGFRSCGTSPMPTSEVCLRFLVRRKWSDRRARAQKIPEFIAAYVVVKGRRVRVRVPTDVSAYSTGGPQAMLNLTSGVTSQRDGIDLEFGSPCCAVRNSNLPVELYLLTCHHVLDPQMAVPMAAGRGCLRSSDRLSIGGLASVADVDSSRGLDAALVRIVDPTVDVVSIWGRRPITKATDFDIEMLHERGALRLLCRELAPAADGLPASQRTEPLSVTFQSLFPNPHTFDYRQSAGRFIDFSDTIQYVGGVRAGDSGSALIDDAGMLYGMHFYGEDNVGFAMSAARIFDPDVFALDISL